MAHDPEGVVEFKAGAKRYRLFFGMRAMKATELHYDKPFFRAIQGAMPRLGSEDLADTAKIAEASADIRLTDLAKLLEFALLKNHPEIEEADVDNMIDTIGLDHASKLLGDSLAAALSAEEKEGDDATANPPPASRKSKTGSRSLVNG